jgi:peptide/nickel transport system permease protein
MNAWKATDSAIVSPTPPTEAQTPTAAPRAAALRTVVLYLVTLLAVVTFVFALPRAMPGDPLSALDDPAAGFYVSDPEIRERALSFYGLDRPLHEQYGSYLRGLATGNLGWSISRNVPVTSLLLSHLPWTLLLMGTALALSSAISWTAGVLAAWHRGRFTDRAVLVALTGLRGVPEYALAALFLITLAVLVPIFPMYGARTPFVQHDSALHALGDIAVHLALPLAALTLSLVGAKFLLVRNTVISALGQDYLLLARAKGLPVRLLQYRHAGRNALLPFLTVLGIQAGFAVGGSIFVEAVFAYPGTGTLILRAVEARDYPVLEGTFLALATTVLLANFLIELAYARLDPRVGAQ